MESWNSRRSCILSVKGMCTSSQPLASSIGIKILESNGNAADAAVAMAAALNMTEPCSTGIGGDAFAIYYNNRTKKVSCLQGNGRTPNKLTLNKLNELGYGYINSNYKPLDPYSIHCVTVPGAAALWDDLVSIHGRLSLAQVLEPAISLGINGFPIHPITTNQWNKGKLQNNEAIRVFRPNNIPFTAGQIIYNKDLANTFRILGEKGAKEGFYKGSVANSIIDTIKEYDGLMELEDLENHRTSFEEPISIVYNNVRIYQTPPPSHGLAVLIALKIYSKVIELNQSNSNSNNIDWDSHVSIESMRLAFADALEYISDPKHSHAPIDILLNDNYITSRANMISDKAITNLSCGDLSAFQTSDTVYFCCVDSEGNACSFINSNYMGFGSGISPNNTGFTLHNRGHNFSLKPNHYNCIDSNKRPYHTIIPGLATNEADNSLYAVFGNMGGFMQPMGHFQLLKRLIDKKLDPQTTVDLPRWYITEAGVTQSSDDLSNSFIDFEDGYDRDIIELLIRRGHVVHSIVTGERRSLFGRAQIILRDSNNVLWGGSDPRADGCSIPQV
eukprot:gene18845-24630_t